MQAFLNARITIIPWHVHKVAQDGWVAKILCHFLNHALYLGHGLLGRENIAENLPRAHAMRKANNSLYKGCTIALPSKSTYAVPWGTKVFTLWLSVLCMRSKAWLAAPVLLTHAEVTENIIYF